VYLVRFGEISLKTKPVRKRATRLLIDNIRAMAQKNDVPVNITSRWDRIYVEPLIDTLENHEKVVDILKHVFGIVSFSKVKVKQFKSLEELGPWIAKLFKEKVKGKTYGVRVRRTGKHGFTSKSAEKFFGDYLWDYAEGVDLTNPDIWVKIEIKDDKAYAILETWNGPGGLPVGMEGKAISLFSGGIDSPVATWMILKRGVKLDFIYFDLGQLNLVLKVFREFCDKWCSYDPKFYVIKFPKIIQKILDTESKYRQVLLKIVMYKIVEEFPYDAFVTGESLAQASSQTLKNLYVINSYTEKLALRPLLGFDKNQTISLAREIGTYNTSSKVPEVCNLATGKVVTAAKKRLIQKLVDELIPLDYEVEIITYSDLIKKYEKHKTKKYDEVIEVTGDNFDELLELVPDENKYPKTKSYLFICRSGMKAGMVAEKWSLLGYDVDSMSIDDWNDLRPQRN